MYLYICIYIYMARAQWIEAVHTYGIALVDGMPATEDATIAFANCTAGRLLHSSKWLTYMDLYGHIYIYIYRIYNV